MEQAMSVVIFLFIIFIWLLWMRMCCGYWIKRWANKNSLTLESYKIAWFHRGPYWFTWFPMPGGPVYRVLISSDKGEMQSGWVWLSLGFFYGGKGKAIWDACEHTVEENNKGSQSQELPDDYRVGKPVGAATGGNVTKALFILPVLFTVGLLISILQQSLFLSEAVIAEATIVELRETKNDSGSILYRSVYVFTDCEGKEVRKVSSMASNPASGKVGDVIEVLYQPDDPDTSIENRYFSRWGVQTVIGIMTILQFIVFGIIHGIKNRHSPS